MDELVAFIVAFSYEYTEVHAFENKAFVNLGAREEQGDRSEGRAIEYESEGGSRDRRE